MQPEWVEEFRGHVVAFTGKVRVDGDWVFRDDCVRMVMTRGALEYMPDMSSKVTLLVHGDLASASVTDKTRQYSKKLKLADQLRANGHPVVVIDVDGFSDLCDGFPARNRQLRAVSDLDVLVLPQVGEGILGGPMRTFAPSLHPGAVREQDLLGLDQGTAAHERTRLAFADALARRGIRAEEAGRRSPRFDLGWVEDNTVFVAEVKSLADPADAHQIRLGLGQVLDYAHRMRTLTGLDFAVRGVVVLEREPVEADHWRATALEAGVTLVWGPRFA